MILQTIKCSVLGCENEYTEVKFNSGFPGWGSVHGISNPDTGEEVAHICPDHLNIIKESKFYEGF